MPTVNRTRLLYRIIILTIISQVVTLTLRGQDTCNATIVGHVVSHPDHAAVPGVTIRLGKNSNHGVVSDYAGKFVINKVCREETYLIANFVGYEADTVFFTLDGNKSTHVEVELREENKILDEVTITGQRNTISPNQSVSKLSAKDIQRSTGKPIGEILKQVTGVSALQTGPTIFKPVIHGLHSQRVMIINNGVRLEGQQWGAEHGPEIDPYIASEITVIKGSDVVQYGSDAIGGAIVIDPPSIHNAEELGGEIYMLGSTNGKVGAFSGMLEGRLMEKHHWKWRLQGTVKRGGDFHAPDYNLTNTGLKELNFSGAAGYRDATKALEIFTSSFNTELGILRAAHTGSMSDLDSAITLHQNQQKPVIADDFSYDIQNPRQEVNHHLGEVRSFYEFEQLGRLNATYSLQLNRRREFDVRRRANVNRPSLDLKLIAHSFDLNLAHKKVGNFNGTIGTSISIKDNKNVSGTGVIPLIPNYDQTIIGTFISEKYTKDKWGTELGLRYDHQQLNIATFDENGQLQKPSLDFSYISLAAGFHYLLSNNWSFNFHYGLGQRPPHVSELYSQGLHHGTASIEFGLLRPGGSLITNVSEGLVKKERSNKMMGTLTYNTSLTSLEVTMYNNLIDNYIFLKPSGIQPTIRGAFVTYNYDQSDVRMTGMDIAFSQNLSSMLEYHGKASIIYAKDVTNNDVVINIPSNRFEHTLKYSLKSIGKLTEPYISTSVVHVPQQVRNPRVVPLEEVRDGLSSDDLVDFVDSPDSYMLVNAEIGFQFPVKESTLHVTLSGENLLNTNYNDYMNRLRYFASDVGRNFSIRIKYNFHTHE